VNILYQKVYSFINVIFVDSKEEKFYWIIDKSLSLRLHCAINVIIYEKLWNKSTFRNYIYIYIYI